MSFLQKVAADWHGLLESTAEHHALNTPRVSDETRHERTAVAAYYIWEQRLGLIIGGNEVEGDADSDWHKAELDMEAYLELIEIANEG